MPINAAIDTAERNVLDGERGAYVCLGDSAGVKVPDTVQATIAARIDRLGSPGKRTLNAAAVMGSRFDADLLLSDRLLFVNGTLMRGLELHANLEGAELLAETRTAPRYRMHSIDDVHPGMYAVEVGGAAIAGELYEVPADVLRRVEEGEPPGLYRGAVELADGRVVPGILYDRELARGQRDITEFGDWRAYMASKSQQPS